MRRAWCVHFRRGGMRRNFNLIDCDLKSSSHVCVCVCGWHYRFIKRTNFHCEIPHEPLLFIRSVRSLHLALRTLFIGKYFFSLRPSENMKIPKKRNFLDSVVVARYWAGNRLGAISCIKTQKVEREKRQKRGMMERTYDDISNWSWSQSGGGRREVDYAS